MPYDHNGLDLCARCGHTRNCHVAVSDPRSLTEWPDYRWIALHRCHERTGLRGHTEGCCQGFTEQEEAPK